LLDLSEAEASWSGTREMANRIAPNLDGWALTEEPEGARGDWHCPGMAQHVRPSASAELRGARLSQGLSLGEVQRRTGIHRNHLKAIELGQGEKLPSGPYSMAYIDKFVAAVEPRFYSECDAETLRARLIRELNVEPAPNSGRREAVSNVPRGRGSRLAKRSRLIVTAYAVLFASVVVGAGWMGVVELQRLDVVDPPSAEGAGSSW